MEPHEQLNPTTLETMKALYHTHELNPIQCTSTLTQTIDAPLALVWSVVRQFNKPQNYKQFVKTCDVVGSSISGAGSVRELTVVSGLPAGRSTERLDVLDDELHLMVVTIVGGDHKLDNYQSTVTLHEENGDDQRGSSGNVIRTVVIESYTVDIPVDSCAADTCLFADTIIGFNLKSLAKVTEDMARETTKTLARESTYSL